MKALVLSLLLILSGCASLDPTQFDSQPPKLVPRQNLLATLPELDGPRIPIAVYGFMDKTGQKKNNDKIWLFVFLFVLLSFTLIEQMK